MANISLRGTCVHTVGELPAVGSQLPEFTLVAANLSELTKADFIGRRLVLNIFPSIDTGVCSMSVRKFNEEAANLVNTTVLCVSMDLPFAMTRFCGAEGLETVITGSAFRSTFGADYGVTLADSPMAGLLSRAVVVADEDGVILHSELVPEISQEPDYAAALAVLA
ncbi:MAG: thiol peroxidase [Propionibacteriaceae bacterium]